MNKRQKIVQEAFLDNEEAVIKRLKQVYGVTLKDINAKAAKLQKEFEELAAEYDTVEDEEEREVLKSRMQSKVYQKKYQEGLKKQVNDILNDMQAKEYKTVSDYLNQCYEEGFVGAMYDLQGQGIPMCFPLDQEAMVQAVQLDSPISQGLYSRLGEDVSILKKKITAQVSRGIATGMTYSQVAKQLSGYTNIGFNNAVRIARTEGHRIQAQSAMNACYKAKEKGADVVKQWDSTLDAKTRESHAMVDREIKELDEKFSNGLMYPGDPSGGAAEVVNCRCALLQRARWALEGGFTKMNNFTKKIEEFERPEDYADFKKAFFSKENRKYMNYVEELEERYSTKNFEKLLGKMSDREYKHFMDLQSKSPLYNKGAAKVAKVADAPQKRNIGSTNNAEEIAKQKQKIVDLYGDEMTLRDYGSDEHKELFKMLENGEDISKLRKQAYEKHQSLLNNGIVDHSKKLQSLDHEEAIIFNMEGKQLDHKKGSVGAVQFDKTTARSYKGQNLTHNHPYNEYGTRLFSVEDIDFADNNGLSSITTIDKDGAIRVLYRDKYFIPEDSDHFQGMLSGKYRHIPTKEKEQWLFDNAEKYGWKYEKVLTNTDNSSIMLLENNKEVRKQYLEEVSKIKSNIDKSLPIEEQARQAFNARNAARDKARQQMKDKETLKRLQEEHPNKTFEELVKDKMKRKGMTREEAIQDVYDTATKTNKNVNKELGIEGDE